MNNLSNYPDGVSGREFAISGPDAEEPMEEFTCPQCSGTSGTLIYHQNTRWPACDDCTWVGEDEFPEEEGDY